MTDTARFRRLGRDAFELLASMRFAIALLTVICIASVIGTVVKQSEPANNYVNQFGPFWAEVYGRLGLFNVYSTPWFLTILAFLVVSTSLCIARNAPKIWTDWHAWKEGVREQALVAFHHHASGELAMPREAALAHVAKVLGEQGWKARVQQREGGAMVAARKGRSNKLGYLAAHSAVVLVCLGGLSDGDLVVKAQMALGGKELFKGQGLSGPVPDRYRLPASNPTFRGNLFVPEGQRAGTAVLQLTDGIILQDLPFDVELKRFIVEYYDTGMPRLFASDVVIHDHDGSPPQAMTIKVNEPARHKGVAIYQSSFDDGGSTVRLKPLMLAASGSAPDLSLQVGGSSELRTGSERMGIEVTALKVINVENMGGGDAVDVRKVDLTQTLRDHLGASDGKPGDKTMRNVGPAVTYKLVDAAGQRREFHNYMQPMLLDGQSVFLFGVRDALDQPFRYLRVPADENGDIAGWQRLRAALLDAGAREAAATRYAEASASEPRLREQLHTTAASVLGLFAGARHAPTANGEAPPPGGIVALSQFMENTIPEDQRPKMSEVLLRVLGGTLAELDAVARTKAGLTPRPTDAQAQAFMSQAMMSLSDSFYYPAPMIYQLDGFDEVQASVFQVARAPGKTLVYIGAILLIVGVFAMLYIRDMRLWVWLADAPEGRTRLTTALAVTRRTMDADRQFDATRRALLGESA